MALGRLFSALPVRQGDPNDMIDVYVAALRDVTHHALDSVVMSGINGSHPKLSRRFAPTTAELGECVRDEMEAVQRQIALAEERKQIAARPPVSAKRMELRERIAQARQRMADEGRQEICDVPSHSASITVRRTMPPGSIYVGILCAWFGPPSKELRNDDAQPVKQRKSESYAEFKRLQTSAREAERGHVVATPVTPETASYWRNIDALPDAKTVQSDDQREFRSKITADLQAHEPAPTKGPASDIEF